MSIEKDGTSVWGLRSQSRPFVIGVELAIRDLSHDRLLPMPHSASSLSVLLIFIKRSLENDRSLRLDVPAKWPRVTATSD
jgi:hypothetical protein